MRISEYAVRNPQLTLVLFTMAALLGLSSLFAIPLAEDPTFPIPGSVVVAVYPGATPTDMERLVADPLEEKLNQLDKVKSIQTTIEDGLAVIRMEFDYSTDADKKYDEVVREVNALRPELPKDLYRLDVKKMDISNVNILQVGIVSDTRPYDELQAEARRLKDRIGRVPGVRTSERWAYPERQVRVEVDPQRLAQLRLPIGRVIEAIQSENSNIPGGTADAGRRQFNVRTGTTYRDVDEVRNTVVAGDGRAIVSVGDIAKVNWGYADLRHIGRWNGHRAVFVTATMKPTSRVGDVRNAVWKDMDEFEKTLPAGVKLVRPFDQSVNVDRRLTRLAEDFAIAILLVLVTLLPLGLRASLVVMVSLPLSLAIGVALLKYTGFSINQLSIVGFVIALGLLVDDSIVVVENISRFLRRGVPRDEAAIAATRQISVAVLGCTATLIAAFIPIFVLPGAAGRYIRSLPAAVVYTILASLLVSLTIVPFLASRLLPRNPGAEGNRILRWLERVIDLSYGHWLHRALAAPRRTVAIAALIFAASLTLVPVIGFSLFPKADTPQFLVRITAPLGTSLAETDRAARYAEAVLRTRPEVRDVLTNVGHGNPTVYYNVSSLDERSHLAELLVMLRAYDPVRTPLMLDSLQRTLSAYPNARIEVKEFENGTEIEAPVAVRLTGEDLDTLRVLAGRAQEIIRSTPGTWNVTNPLEIRTTGVRMRLRTQKAGMLGVPTVEVNRAVRLALVGAEVGKLRDADGTESPIRVRLADEPAGQGLPPSLDGAPSLRALDRLYVPSLTGAAVPLRQIADATLETAIPSIQHYDKVRSVTVGARVRTGFNTDRVTKVALGRLAALHLPPGYRLIPAGEIESRQESFGDLNGAIIVTVFLILALLILEFGTFKSTLIVASVIPLGVVGGLVALLLTGYTLSFTAMIGFIALIGIEIKNSILLVDFANQLRRQGRSVREAVEEAGRIRFLPILLTTLTAVGGLLPLALQRSSLYSPLAFVLIGGLLSSTLLARLVTPSVYLMLAPDVAPREAPQPAAAAAELEGQPA